jgi:HK97 family phage major capsid protein
MENLSPDQVVEKINCMISEKLANTATMDDVNSIKENVAVLQNLNQKSSDIEKALAKIEGRMESLVEKAQSSPVRYEHVSDQICNQIKNGVETLRKGQSLTFDTKDTTATTIVSNSPDWAGGNGVPYTITSIDPGIDKIVVQKPTILSLCNRGVSSSRFITYVSETANGGPATSMDNWIGEGVEKPDMTFSYQELSIEMKKMAASIKVSMEMLDDIGFIRSEINSNLLTRLQEYLDYSLLNGNLAGFYSLYTNADDLTLTPFLGRVIQPSHLDVLRCAVAEMEETLYYPTAIVMHPADVAFLQIYKSTNAGYNTPFWYPGGNALTINGIPIIATTYISQGDFVIGDFSKLNVRFRNNLSIQTGYVNDDFKKNMVTILAEARVCSFVKANQVNAFKKGNFTTLLAAIAD